MTRRRVDAITEKLERPPSTTVRKGAPQGVPYFGGGAHELDSEVIAAPTARVVARAPASVPASAPPTPRHVRSLIAAFGGLRTERDWFAEGAIERTPLVSLIGPEKTAKSWAAQQCAVATITGASWLGTFPIRRSGRVLYADAEYGDHETARRMARIARAEGHRPEEVLADVVYYAAHSLRLAPDSTDVAALLQYAKHSEPALVIFDPFRNMMEGDENSALDMLNALDTAARFRDVLGCPVIVVHHLNKQGKASGSRAFRTRCDLVIEGTDDDTPVYSSVGRTVRRNDAINKRFSIEVAHENDDDDLIARTFVRASFEGEPTTHAALSRSAQRVRDVLKGAASPMTVRAIRTRTNMNNSTAKNALEELRVAGIASTERDGWSLGTSAFFASLKTANGDDGRQEDR